MPMIMMLGRELREVPLDYEHPLNARTGRPKSLHLEYYEDALDRWLKEREEWNKDEGNTYRQWQKYKDEGEAKPLFAVYNGGPPDPDYYLHEKWDPDAPKGIQMWETVSEGSPISKVFPDTDEGRTFMAFELAKTETDSVLSHFDPSDWREVIDGYVFGTDIQTGEKAMNKDPS